MVLPSMPAAFRRGRDRDFDKSREALLRRRLRSSPFSSSDGLVDPVLSPKFVCTPSGTSRGPEKEPHLPSTNATGFVPLSRSSPTTRELGGPPEGNSFLSRLSFFPSLSTSQSTSSTVGRRGRRGGSASSSSGGGSLPALPSTSIASSGAAAVRTARAAASHPWTAREEALVTALHGAVQVAASISSSGLPFEGTISSNSSAHKPHPLAMSSASASSSVSAFSKLPSSLALASQAPAADTQAARGLVAALADLDRPLREDLLTRVAECVATTPALLEAFVWYAGSARSHPPADGAVAARFLTDGPVCMRLALVRRAELVEFLVLSFPATWRGEEVAGPEEGIGDASVLAVPAAVIDRVAALLRCCLVEDGGRVGSALLALKRKHEKAKRADSPSGIEKSCPMDGPLGRIVDGVPFAAGAAHLLARLVATRMGSATCMSARSSMQPAHKKGLHFVADAQKLLAARAVGTLQAVSTHNGAWVGLNAVERRIDALVGAMVEISLRASIVKRKEEDPDERGDGHFVAHMGFIPASTYNDGLRKLTLLASPEPLLQVLDACVQLLRETECEDRNTFAVKRAERAQYLVPVLEGVTKLFAFWRDATHSDLPSVRRIALKIDPARMSHAILARLAEIGKLLRLWSHHSETKPFGLRRPQLAVADVLLSMLRTGHSGVLEMLVEPSVTAHVTLLRYAANSSVAHGELLLNRILCVIEESVKESIPASEAWLSGGSVLQLILEDSGWSVVRRRHEGSASARLGAKSSQMMASMQAVVQAVDEVLRLWPDQAKLADVLRSVDLADRFRVEVVLSAQEGLELKRGLLSEHAPKHHKLSSDLAYDIFDSDTAQQCSEDDTHSVFLHYQLADATSTASSQLASPLEIPSDLAVTRVAAVKRRGSLEND